MPQTQGVCPWVERVVSVANVERETTGPSGGGRKPVEKQAENIRCTAERTSGWKQELRC